MRSIAASLPSPPLDPAEGSCFRVTTPASAEWAGHADDLAIFIGGEWHFIRPVAGMQVFDQSAARMVIYRTQWESAAAPPAATEGAVVDLEARSAIAALVAALQAYGILASTSP